MNIIQNQTFDQERAFKEASHDTHLRSSFQQCAKNVTVRNSIKNPPMSTALNI